MNADQLCPCGSQINLSGCCLPFIERRKQPETAEKLLRARYTAFTLGQVDFIIDTHHSETRGDVKRDEIEEWSRDSDWLGLKIVESKAGAATDSEGLITFCAKYELHGKIEDHWEVSQFRKEDGQWRFFDARALKQEPFKRAEPKVGRNDPCPCGSGKKQKKCCNS
ncbi:MAG: hypothetical protein A2428_07130 [Bdellovibrionales bacterium RIFOXYC1_FULL_54_43]|nr:MAG: hypothetical protein A2428_07130 [Bdellovibrionales bacterium RIFOXYC1_FULL_54_43]OFZ79315.1 MAG: hypothetical protein A2603_08715 [Bdellovibrionales bacterium RIFOXYD1_FULL_55_31]